MTSNSKLNNLKQISQLNSLNVRSSDSSSKECFNNLLIAAVQHECLKKNEIILGINKVCQAIEMKTIAVIVIAKDANIPIEILNYIILGAKLNDISIVIFTKFKHMLASACNVKTASCIAILTNIVNENQVEDEIRQSKLDALRDYAITLSKMDQESI